jgi:hypothetical protein
MARAGGGAKRNIKGNMGSRGTRGKRDARRRAGLKWAKPREATMSQVEQAVQAYYGGRPLLQRIDAALRAAGKDPDRINHRDLWPYDQLHGRGVAATREHAERAGMRPGLHVLDLGCGVGGASRYLAAECGCRVTAIDLTPAFVEVARTLKPGGRFSCEETVQGPTGPPTFPLPWATDASSSFLVTPAAMRAALEAGGLHVLSQTDITATGLAFLRDMAGKIARGEAPPMLNQVVMGDDFPMRQRNTAEGTASGRLLNQFILAQRPA